MYANTLTEARAAVESSFEILRAHCQRNLYIYFATHYYMLFFFGTITLRACTHNSENGNVGRQKKAAECVSQSQKEKEEERNIH